MEINIRLTKENVDKLLKNSGYVSEKILVHFEPFTLEDISFKVEDLDKYYLNIAYPSNQRPQCLDKDIIMIDDVKHMKLEDVVNKLFMERLMNKIFL